MNAKAERRLREMDQNEAFAWAYRIHNRMLATPVLTPKRKRLAAQYADIGYAAAMSYPTPAFGDRR